jgi:hypothetical protein
MFLGVHAGQADQFARQVETGDLFFAGVAQAEGLQGAGAYCINGIEGVTLAEQELAFFSGRPRLTISSSASMSSRFRKWQAERGQAAILAMGLVVSAQFDWLGHFLNPCGKTHISRKGNPREDIQASLGRDCPAGKAAGQTKTRGIRDTSVS